MGIVQRNLSDTFNRFFASEKSSGILLILCTVAFALDGKLLNRHNVYEWVAGVCRWS